MRHRLFAGSVILTSVLAACGESNISIHAELMRLPDVTSAGFGLDATVPPWTSDLALTSVRSPITAIELRDGSRAIEVYRCPSASFGSCLVELNGPALSSLLPTSPVPSEPGTYNEIVVYYCGPGETGWSAQLTGTATLGGATYYTRSAGNELDSVGPAQPVTVAFNGCASTYPIVPPLAVSSDSTTTIRLRLYFDIRDLAYAALNHATTNQLLAGFSCSGASTIGFVCASYTTIFAVPGTIVPTVERYRVNTNATFGLVFESSTDRFVGGYVRRYYVEDAGFSPGFGPDGHFDILTPSGPGTYRLAQSHAPRLDLPLFERASHSGTLSVDVGSATPLVISYTALRLP